MPECADGTGVPGGDPVSEGADPHPSRQQRADHPPAVCSLPACGGHGRFQPAAAWLGAVLHYGNCTHAVKKLRRYVAARVGRYLHRRRGQWLWGYTMYPDQFLHERYGLFAIPLTAPWKQVPVHVRRGTVSESRMRENCTYGVMRGAGNPSPLWFVVGAYGNAFESGSRFPPVLYFTQFLPNSNSMHIFLPYILNLDYLGLLDLAIEKWSPILDGLARTLSIQGQVINDSGKMIRRV